MDMYSDRIAPLLDNPRLHFFEGDITINREWIEYHVKKCDVVLPLVAIATPGHLRARAAARVRAGFRGQSVRSSGCASSTASACCSRRPPRSTACATTASSIPYASELVYGPIDKPRWIYACSKQLLDRVIHAYGMRDELDYTLFRPFNWIGPGLDNMHAAKEGSSRVITQFLGHIVRGEDVRLVDGGQQRRCFTGVSDGIDALMKMIENARRLRQPQDLQRRQSRQQPVGARAGAARCCKVAATYPEYRANAAKVRLVDTTAAEYYGKGYQDVENRVPKIDNTRADLDWTPRVTMQEALRQIFDAYRGEIAQAGKLLEQDADVQRRAESRVVLQLALKIDVDTLRGTREGVPALVDALQARARRMPPSCSASGPTTPAARCGACSGRGFFRARCRAPRCSSTTACSTLLYGTLLPGPDIGRRAGRRDAQRARRRLRGRRALLRSHHLAGLRQPARRGLDARPDAARGATAFAKCSASSRRCMARPAGR